MKKIYCKNCFCEKASEDSVCPQCGKARGQEKNPAEALSIGTILGGQYLTGGLTGQDEWCLEYAALDLSTETKVTVKEFYLKEYATRNGDSLVWSGSTDIMQKTLQRFQTVIDASPEGSSVLRWFSENGTVYCVESAAVPDAAPQGNIPSAVEVPEIQPEKEAAAPAVPQEEAISAEKSPSKSKNTSVIVTSVLAAAAAIALIWCGVYHWLGTRNMDSGLYSEAFSSFSNDFLFSGKDRLRAIELAAGDAYGRADFSAAADYYRMLGEDGAEGLADSVLAQAQALIDSGSPEEAIELLETIEQDERAEALLGSAQLEIARNLFSMGKTNDALDMADSIKNTSQADVVGFKNSVHEATAEKCISIGDLRGAVSEYGLCVDVDSAAVNSKILEAILRSSYCEATDLADAAVKAKRTGFSRTRWMNIVSDNMTPLSNNSGVDESLDFVAAEGIIAGDFEADMDEIRKGLESDYDFSTMIGTIRGVAGEQVLVDDIQALYAQCGTAPAGKILFVVCAYDFPDKNATYGIDLTALKLLPPKYRPRSLSEVEHIVLVTYDYSRTGSYSKGTIAVRERAYVEIFQMPKKLRVWQSGQKQGNSPPSSFTYWYEPPEFKSGGIPNMGGYIADGLKTIIK